MMREFREKKNPRSYEWLLGFFVCEYVMFTKRPQAQLGYRKSPWGRTRCNRDRALSCQNQART